MKKSTLIFGDVLAILIVTFIGFASHGELGAGSPSPYTVLPRMAAIFFPLVITWFILAPFFGLFQPEITTNRYQLWRPALAMVFAGSMAVIVRGLLLNAPIIPIFAVVLSTTSAVAILIWRGIFLFMNRSGGSRSATTL